MGTGVVVSVRAGTQGPLDSGANKKKQKKRGVHPRWDSNPQSSAPETDALSIWPLGRYYALSGVRTHADRSPADLKSAPLDLSGIQACTSAAAQTCPDFLHSYRPKKQKKVLPGLKPGLKDSESLVMTITL